MDEWFQTMSYLHMVISDNGAQFRTKFNSWCKEHGIFHQPSSPYNPHSNGLAESPVKIAKFLLSKSDNYADFLRRLLSWRNVPLVKKSQSPVELFFNRCQRTGFPSLPTEPLLVPPEPDASSLHPLSVGNCIRLQNLVTRKWDEKGVIEGITSTGLSYVIRCEDDSTCTQGRHLVKLDKSDPPSTLERVGSRTFLPPSAHSDKPVPDMPSNTPTPPRRSRR